LGTRKAVFDIFFGLCFKLGLCSVVSKEPEYAYRSDEVVARVAIGSEIVEKQVLIAVERHRGHRRRLRRGQWLLVHWRLVVDGAPGLMSA
jgi:hypothetical protein